MCSRRDIRVTRFATARQAVASAKARKMTAVHVNGRPAIVSGKDAERWEAAGLNFAYLCDHNGTLVTIPVH